MKRIVKMLRGEHGELYCTVDGRRLLLARCSPTVEIIEESQQVSSMGSGYKVKSCYITVALCNELDTTRTVDMDFLHTVSGFDLALDIQRPDGIFERIIFNNMTPIEIDLDGEWSFEITGQSELTKKLMKM